jgi:hypothetical protein
MLILRGMRQEVPHCGRTKSGETEEVRWLGGELKNQYSNFPDSEIIVSFLLPEGSTCPVT